MVAALNVADKGAGIWTKYEGFPLWGAVGIFVISLGFMGYMRWSDGSALLRISNTYLRTRDRRTGN